MEDQYVESKGRSKRLPYAVTSIRRTANFSLDGGQQWQPLTLKLPAVRVNDVEIQPEQHAVVLATFGRGFWVLDNLQFLEQLGAAQVASDAPYVFRPQQAWLVTRRTGGFGPQGPGGANLAPGATVSSHLPAAYNGSMPVKPSFTDASAKSIRRFTMHLKTKEQPKPLSDNPAVRSKASRRKGDGDRAPHEPFPSGI